LRAVDTNVLVRLIVGDDAHQTAAADAFVQQGVRVSIITLADAIWVLKKSLKLSPVELAATIEMLLNHRDITLQDFDAVAAALDLFRSRPALGFYDCLILEVARKAGHLPLATFDRALGKVEGTQKLLDFRP
jgi:predicted nucleic-acid-binding protein